MSMICCLQKADEAQINELLANPESIYGFIEAGAEQVELDKAWHGIHFLLTGSAWEGEEPLCYLVKGGEEIGDEDIGYGPARALKPQQVAAWADALSAISDDVLGARFDPGGMAKAEIYPWGSEPEEDDALEYLLEYYGILCSFVERTKNENKGAIVYLT